MKKMIALLCLLVVSNTVFSQQNEEEPIDVPKIAIKIPLGKTVDTQGYSVTFKEVLEDSRCPTNVTCVWAGRVRIKVEINKAGKQLAEEVLIFGAVQPEEEKNHLFFTSEELKLEGIKVTPYPKTETEKQEKNYTLLVCAYKN